MSANIIVADTSCLIVLQNIRELSLLQKLFATVSITNEVEKEFGAPLPDWIQVRIVADVSRTESLSLILDAGEASSIALCLESEDALLIIDEKKGRRIARELDIKTIGTIGVILKAYDKGLIVSIEVITKQLEDAGFYVSEYLKEHFLKK